MKKFLLAVLLMTGLSTALTAMAQSVFRVQQGGTGYGTTTAGSILLTTTSPISLTRLSPIGFDGLFLRSSSTSPTLWDFSAPTAILSGGTNGYLTRWLTSSTVGTGASIDNGTVAGVNATSSTSSFNIQGTGALNPLRVASSTGTALLTIAPNGSTTLSSLGTGPIYGASGSLYTNGTTGTGLTVQATSPTLVTPILGVASGTALTLSNNLWVTGQTSLGNASSTALTVSGLSRLASTTVTGTLNVTGNVGIGTTTPQSELEVVGNVQAQQLVLQGQADMDIFFRSLAGVDQYLIDGSSDFLINDTVNNRSIINYDRAGNTVDASDINGWQFGALSANSTLSVTGTSTLSTTTATQLTVSGKTTLSNATATAITITENLYLKDALLISQSCLGTSSSGKVQAGSCTGGSGNSAWTILSGVIHNATSTDLIGIGTSTPAYKLSIVGTAGNGNILNVASSTGTSVFRVFDGSQSYYPAMAGYAVSGAPWIFLNAGAAGTPTYTFNGNQTTGMYLPATNSIGFSTAGVGRMAIDANGIVGIGTLTPTTTQSALLHLDHTSFARIMVTASTSPNQVVGFFDARAESVSRWQMGTKSNHPMVFYTNDAARLGIWASGGLAYGSTYSFTNDPGANTAIFEGSVGIGTSTPAYKLTVVGTAGNNNIFNIATSTGTSILQVTALSQILTCTTCRLTIPQGTAPTLSAAGDIAVDTSNGGMLSFYANGRENLVATTTKAFFIQSPTASESHKTVPGYSFDVPVTITKVRCLITSDSNTPSWTFSLPHSTALGTASANAMSSGQACTSTTTPQTITIGGDLTLAAGEVIWATSSAVTTASTTQIWIDFKYDN